MCSLDPFLRGSCLCLTTLEWHGLFQALTILDVLFSLIIFLDLDANFMLTVCVFIYSCQFVYKYCWLHYLMELIKNGISARVVTIMSSVVSHPARMSQVIVRYLYIFFKKKRFLL